MRCSDGPECQSSEQNIDLTQGRDFSGCQELLLRPPLFPDLEPDSYMFLWVSVSESSITKTTKPLIKMYYF